MNDLASSLEYVSLDEATAVQQRMLVEHIGHCALRSGYYQRRFAEWGVRPEDVTLDTLGSIPTTTKQDLAAHNDEFIACARDEAADISLTSGTTGRPVQIVNTDADLQRLAANEAMSFRACGITASDRVLLTCTMDRCFVAGLAYYLGLRACGATVVRNGLSQLESHARLCADLQATAIVGVPSFLKKLGLHIREQGSAREVLPVRKLVCIGEPLRQRDLQNTDLSNRIQELWQALDHSTYASTECASTFCECEARQGGHHLPTMAIFEVLDSEGNPVPDETPGEVVLTPLGVQGTPLLRYRTGDVSFRISARCACGRTTARLGPILGRTNHMLKIRGVTIYPQAVFDAIEAISGVMDFCLTATTNADGLDDLAVDIAGDDALSEFQVSEMISNRLRIRLIVRKKTLREITDLVHAGASRKPVRFHDKRSQI